MLEYIQNNFRKLSYYDVILNAGTPSGFMYVPVDSMEVYRRLDFLEFNIENRTDLSSRVVSTSRDIPDMSARIGLSRQPAANLNCVLIAGTVKPFSLYGVYGSFYHAHNIQLAPFDYCEPQRYWRDINGYSSGVSVRILEILDPSLRASEISKNH